MPVFKRPKTTEELLAALRSALTNDIWGSLAVGVGSLTGGAIGLGVLIALISSGPSDVVGIKGLSMFLLILLLGVGGLLVARSIASACARSYLDSARSLMKEERRTDCLLPTSSTVSRTDRQ